jgi:hypothetical protein
LLKDLGIVLSNENRVFNNPEPIKIEKANTSTPIEKTKQAKAAKTIKAEKKPKTVKQNVPEPTSINLFAGLFD